MLNNRLQAIFAVLDDGVKEAIAVTSSGTYRLDSNGYHEIDRIPAGASNVLPRSFEGRTILEVRWGGGDLMMRLGDGSFICLCWTIDTRTGESYRDLFFHEKEEIDEAVLSSFSELESTS